VNLHRPTLASAISPQWGARSHNGVMFRRVLSANCRLSHDWNLDIAASFAAALPPAAAAAMAAFAAAAASAVAWNVAARSLGNVAVLRVARLAVALAASPASFLASLGPPPTAAAGHQGLTLVHVRVQLEQLQATHS